MRTKFIIGALGIVALAGIVFYTPQSSQISQFNSESPEVKPPEIRTTPPIIDATTTRATTSALEEGAAPIPNATLLLGGRMYAVFAPSGSTVLDAMRTLASTSDFTFSGREYPSLGYFVDSVGGKKAESGYSWILYLNGKLSGTGVSQTKLEAGDAIEWRYEKNY